MRRATFLLAALAALAGCTVQTEGAACQVPNSTEQCPEGQRCGIDGRCAENPLLECPPAGSVIGVDPEASGKLEGDYPVVPTGADEVPGCRLALLQDALDAAGDAAPAAVTVKVYEQSTGPLVVQLQGTLVVPGNVKLTTETTTPSDYVLRAVSGFPAADDIVRLTPGATLEGFTVTTDIDTTGSAIGTVLPCATTATTTLSRLRLSPSSGGTIRRFDRGIAVIGACTIAATDVEVAGARREGVFVLPQAAPAELPALTLAGGAVRDSGGSGVRVRGGRVVVSGTEVTGSAIHGILAEWLAADRPLDVQVVGADVHANQGVGLYAKDLAGATGSKLVVTGTRLRNNAGLVDSNHDSGRKAGGLLLYGGPLPAADFTFRGNTVCSNGGADADEIAVYGSGSAGTANWKLGATAIAACAAEGNKVYDAAAGAVLLWCLDDVYKAQAQLNFWTANPPTAGTVVNADTSPTCGAVTSAPSGC